MRADKAVEVYVSALRLAVVQIEEASGRNQSCIGYGLKLASFLFFAECTWKRGGRVGWDRSRGGRVEVLKLKHIPFLSASGKAVEVLRVANYQCFCNGRCYRLRAQS